MRRAWIEMLMMTVSLWSGRVALHAEGVDRNQAKLIFDLSPHVALHAEGVDRNSKKIARTSASLVALHAEGVDRNI